MRLATSYFYQVRNFKPNMIPISTAVSDPMWYHKGYDKSVQFYDSNGIVNGARCELLVPGRDLQGLCNGQKACAIQDHSNCPFLQSYAYQLSQLPRETFLSYLDKMVKWVKTYTNIEIKDLVLVFLVYEKYDNPCSERQAILDYIRSIGLEIHELDYPIQ